MRLFHGLIAAGVLAGSAMTATAVAETVYDCDKCKVIIEDNGSVKIRDANGKLIPGMPPVLFAPTKPIPAMAAPLSDFAVPPPPETKRTVNVCHGDVAPDCVDSIERALKKHPGSGLHIRVHCGSYQGNTVDLRRRSNIWIEGLPCADGGLPVIALDGQKNAWVEFSPMGGPPISNLRVEKLQITGPGERKAAIRLNGSGPMVVKDVVIENQQNGIFVTERASGDVWVVNSRFDMNGHGRAGKQHHVYASCKSEDCRLYVINSRFGGLYSAKGKDCSNQVRVRAREAYVLNSIFDARTGCVSRSLNTSPQNHRLVVRNSVFIQGNTENSQIMMTPMGGDTAGELVLENSVVVSQRDRFARVIGVLAKSQIRLTDVTIFAKSGCSDGHCIFTKQLDPAQVQTYEKVRIVDSPGDLPKQVRELL